MILVSVWDTGGGNGGSPWSVIVTPPFGSAAPPESFASK